MYHYLFTNDLRISALDKSLKRVGHCFMTNTVPSSTEDKSANNNMMTLGFYFTLNENSNCAKIAATGNIRAVVLNFIKKFQFPNMRTTTAFKQSKEDGISLAPMRVIVKLLYTMNLLHGSSIAYLSKEEIKNFIFYNEAVAKNKHPDIVKLISDILMYRKTGNYPTSVNLDESEHEWKHEDRQIREMLKVLQWSGCITEKEGKYVIDNDELSDQNKADVFDIINCDTFWEGETLESYQKYMDITINEHCGLDKFDFSTSSINEGQNLIVYGTPGCGKSYYVEHTLLKDYPTENYVRTTFFQDYTNTDFVGQILPVVDGEKVTYKFNPGPFTLALEQAIEKPNEKVALVIEELNRGSAASIFGDIFQLLDRKNGVSEYSINNVNIINYLKEKFEDKYTFDSIKLPGNLSIYATMNTSDQNVFTLDTAFKRRWKFKKLLNKFENDHKFKDKYIPGANITWKNFVDGINKYILESSSGLNSEDKQLGVYFVDDNGMRDSSSDTSESQAIEDFAYKVLEYLWADVAKFDRPGWFDKEIKSLDDLVAEYKKRGLEVFADEVFNK